MSSAERCSRSPLSARPGNCPEAAGRRGPPRLSATQPDAFTQVVSTFTEVEGSPFDSRGLGQTHTKQAEFPLLRKRSAILYTSGVNYRGKACACISFPISSGSGFVRGTRRTNPDRDLTDVLGLAIAISAPWLSPYFDTPGGG